MNGLLGPGFERYRLYVTKLVMVGQLLLCTPLPDPVKSATLNRYLYSFRGYMWEDFPKGYSSL
jgi:hypothetical protein